MSEIAGGADAVLSLRLEVTNTEQLATLDARIKALSKIEPGQVVDPKAKGEIEALSNSVAQFKNKIAQLEGENRTLAASLSNVTATADALKQKFKGLGSGLKGGFDPAVQQARDLRVQMGNLYGETVALARGYDNLGKKTLGAQALMEKYGRQSAQAFLGQKSYLLDLIPQLDRMRVSTAGSVGALSDVTKSTAAASKGMRGFSAAQWEAHAAARGLAGSLGALWVTYGSLVPLLTGAAIGSALKSMVQTGAEVEYQLAMIEAVGEGAKVSMTELAAATTGSVFSFGEATNALRVLVQAGQSSEDALRTLPTVLKLATIGEVELGKGALTVAAMLETFNLSAGEASRVTNAMAAAAASSPTSVGAMMEAMKQASSMSSQYSVSLEETSAALAVLAKRGIEGTAAGTAFRNLVKELAAPATDKAAKSLEAMGISMFDANGNIKPLTENLQQLADVAKLMSQEDRIKWFESFTNERAAKALDALVMDMEGFRKVTEEVTLAQQGLGFVTEANAKLMTSVSGQWQQLGADMQRVFAGVYESMQPALLNLTMTLREVVASDGFKSALTGLANSFVTLTNFVLENGKAIGAFLALLAGHSVITTFASVLKTAGLAAAGLSASLAALRTATTAFVATNAAAGVATGTFAAALGGLGTLLSGPVGWALAAVGVAVGAVVLSMNRAEDASDDLADSIQKTGNIFTILEDAARRGSEEIGKETEMIRAQIQALKDGTTAAYEFSKASSWKAMVEAQQGFTSNDLQLTQRREAFHSKYGVMPEQASSGKLDSYMRREAEKDAKALVELGKQHAATYKRMVDTEEQYRNALEQGAERGALAAELESSKRVAALESQRQAFIAAGAEASKALESGLTFPQEKTKALEEAIERGAKAAQIALPTMEAYSSGAADAVGQLVQAESALNDLRIKPPEIESPFKKLTDDARASLEAARTAIQDFKNAYADVLSGIKDGTDRLEIGPLEAYERSMAAAAAAYEDMFAAIARAKNTPGLTSSALQKLLTDENKLIGEANRETQRLLDERNAALEARNNHLEELEISVGKKVLSAADAWLREYQGKYGKTVAALQADITHAEEALAEAIEKGAAPAEIDALRKSLAALRAESARFDAGKGLGAWAAAVKESMEQAEKSISTMLESLEEFGARSEKKGFLGILMGDASTFSRMNNANILELRETIAELQRELERAVPGSDLEVRLRAKIYDFEKSLRAAEETVHPTLEGWGDSLGDYIAQGIVYGFEEGESPLKRFAKTLQSELAKVLSDQLSSMFKGMLNGMFGGFSNSFGLALGSVLGFHSPSAASGTNLLGTANSAYSLYNGASNLYNTGAIGYQWATGTMSGANAAGTLYANATGTGMDGLFAATGWGTQGSAAGASGMMSGLASAGAYAAIALAVVSLIGDIFGDDPDPRMRYKMSSDLGDTSGWEDGVAYAEGPFGYVGLDEASTREVKGRKFKEQLAALAAFDTMLASVMSRDEVAAVRSGMDGWMSSADRDTRDYRRDPDLALAERLVAISESAGGAQWEEVLGYIRGTQLGSDTGWVTDENGFVTQPNILQDGTTIADLFGKDALVTAFADAGAAGANALQDALRGVAAETAMLRSGYSDNEGVSQTWLDEQVNALIGDMPQSLDDLSVALQGFGLTVEEIERIAIDAANAPFGTGRAGARTANAAQLDGEALAQYILRGFQADNVQSMLEKVGQDIGRDAARTWMDASTTSVVGEDGKETSLDGYGVLMGNLAANYAALYQTQESAWKQAQENLGDMFDEIGVSVPASIDEFKRLTEAQDLNTEAGRKLYSELWGLAPAFLEVANAVEQTFASISKTTAESIREIEMSILDNAGKYEYLDTEIGSLLEKLSAATDPATIQGLFEQINSKTTQAFNLLDGDEQKRLATDFIDRLYEAESVAQSRLSVTPIDYQPQQDAATKQSEAAVKQEEAAAKLVAAAEKIMTALGLMEGHSEEGAGALIVAGQQLRAAATHLSNAVAGEQSTEMR